tara:strand:+ start:8808 stop:10595 length:1788 start_codon:yes stop_codon:yes gene_type:complete
MLKNKQFILGVLIISFVVYLTHVWINFFYIATLNVDFSKYYDYINYFLGVDVDIDYGQGALYYYLISISINNKIELINIGNIDYILSSSVHNVNLVIFIFGLIGIYRLLKFKNFDNFTIFISILGLLMFPQSIYMRAVMKPEILCFATLPWILLYLEKFIVNKNTINIILPIPFLVIALNTKGSVAGMILFYFFISYFKVFKILNIKSLLIVSLIFVSILSVMQFENFRITQTSPIERPYDPEFDYKASPDIIFRFSPGEIIRKPFFRFDYQQNYYDIHAKSAINLIILDTFGDYFNQMFDSRQNYFSKNRKDFIVNDSNLLINNKREINYAGPLSSLLMQENYIRKLLSIFFSVIFYILIFRYLYKDKENWNFYIAPFFGIFILYLNAIGIPSNNFNPYKGDTFKAFYFSFFLSIAFVFVVSNIFKKNPKFKLVLIFLFGLVIMFISGHPKNNSQFESERLVAANEYSLFCSVNNILFFENNLLKTLHATGNVNEYRSDCKNQSSSKLLFLINREDYDSNFKDECVDGTNNLLYSVDKRNVSIERACRIYTIELSNNENINFSKPYFAVLLLILSMSIVIYETRIYEKIYRFNN